MTARMAAKQHMQELHKQRNFPPVQMATIATQTDATGNPGTGGKKKKKKKKKKKSDTVSELASERASEVGLDEEFGHSDSDDETVAVFVRSNRSNSAEVEMERVHRANPSTEVNMATDRDTVLSLPLSVRLEKAASHPDLKAGLNGLIDWSNSSLSPEVVDVFFKSKALKLLLENFFRICPMQTTLYEGLTKLFANLLVGSFPFHFEDGVPTGRKNTSTSLDAARLVVQSIRSTVDSLRTLKRYKDKAPQIASLIPQVASGLTKLIKNHQAQHVFRTRSGSGDSDDGCDFSKDILKLDEQLRGMIAKENAIRGQTIRDSFRRRDLRSETISLSAKKMDALMSFVVDANAKRAKTIAATPDIAPKVTNGSIPSLELEGQNTDDVASIKARLSQLHRERQAQMAPWQEKKEKVSNELMELKYRHEELRKMLSDVDARIGILNHLHEDMIGELVTIEATFEEEIARLANENLGVVSDLHNMEKKQEIVGTFRGLRSTLDTLSSTALLQKVQDTTNQHIDGVHRYVSAQAICVQFMKNRIVDADTQRTKLNMELQATESLGEDTSSVQTHLAELTNLINEETKSLQSLKVQDTQIRDEFDRLLKTLEAEGTKDDSKLVWNDATVAEIYKLFAKIFSVYAQCEINDEGDQAESSHQQTYEAEELEDEITQANLARLEQGQRPTRSPRAQ